MLRHSSASIFALLLLTLSGSSQSAIYKYVDADGNTTFSDKNQPGAVKFADDPAVTVTVTGKRRNKIIHNTSPANFPKVDASTQHMRDDIRRTLLEEERSKEQKNLTAANNARSSTGKKTSAEQDKLAENIRLHEKNIEMLDKELARIK